MDNTSLLPAVLITALVIALSGCDSTGSPVVDKAKAALKSTLKDPYSVRFSKIRVEETLENVCGQFNAKNGFGAYVGNKTFFYSGFTGKVSTGYGAKLMCEASSF